MSADAAGLTGPEVVTLLLALDLLANYARTEQHKANRAGNVLKSEAMQAMQAQIAVIRAKLQGTFTTNFPKPLD